MRQINPSGKISLSPSGKSSLRLTPSCLLEGALAIVTERWDGMRWTRRHRARDGTAGRDKLRERSFRTCGRAVPERTAKACGPDASMVGVKSRGGAKAQPGLSAGFREATEARRARYSGVSAR